MRSAATVGLGVILAGCGGGDDYGPGGGGNTQPPPPPVQTSSVTVRDSRYDPENVAVAAGTTVTWTWAGGLDHTLTFQDGQGSVAARSSGSSQRTFGAPGTYRYRCTIHSTGFDSGMIGSVVVN